MSTTSKNTPEQVIAAIKRIVMEIQQDGNYELIDQFISENWYNHTALPGTSPKREGVEAVMKYLHATFNDIKIEIAQCVSDGRVVGTNKVLRGKLVGNWRGREGKGEKVELRIMDFLTVGEDGKFVEHWACLGDLIDLEE